MADDGRDGVERTQATVVESLWRTNVRPSCLLLDTGSVWVGVAVSIVRFSVSLDEKRRERMNHIPHQLIFERNARILSSFSCTEAGFHVQCFTSCCSEVEDYNHFYSFVT